MFKDKLKNIFQSKEGEENIGQKKKIENLVFFVVMLIITIVVINFIWKDKKSSTQKVEESTDKKLASLSQNNIVTVSQTEEKSDLEQRLESILAKIQGVGEVQVFINYSETSEVVAMYNENSKTSTTEETDTSGGIRKIQETDTQKDIIYQEEDGVKTPMTKKIIEPKIEGAIITAKGANQIDTKTNIIQAVEAVTGLATHKIQVFEMQ